MIEDPIVEEIHQIREKILSGCSEDLDKLLDRYKLAEEQDQARLVTKDVIIDRIKKSKGRLMSTA
jgi:hypothetical protein